MCTVGLLRDTIQKFRINENSDSHLEAKLKCTNEQLNSQASEVQAIRRAGLVKQHKRMKFHKVS